jgi:hypothetical protein
MEPHWGDIRSAAYMGPRAMVLPEGWRSVIATVVDAGSSIEALGCGTLGGTGVLASGHPVSRKLAHTQSALSCSIGFMRSPLG